MLFVYTADVLALEALHRITSRDRKVVMKFYAIPSRQSIGVLVQYALPAIRSKPFGACPPQVCRVYLHRLWQFVSVVLVPVHARAHRADPAVCRDNCCGVTARIPFAHALLWRPPKKRIRCATRAPVGAPRHILVYAEEDLPLDATREVPADPRTLHAKQRTNSAVLRIGYQV